MIHDLTVSFECRVLATLLFVPFSTEMFDDIENRLIVYADDSRLLAVVRKPSERPTLLKLNACLRRISRELWDSSENIRGDAWNLLP